MACSIDVLVIALQLARGLVVQPEMPNHQSTITCHFEPSYYGDLIPCSTYKGTETDWWRELVVRRERAEAEAGQRAADYKEFQRIVEMCSTPKGKQ